MAPLGVLLLLLGPSTGVRELLLPSSCTASPNAVSSDITLVT
jgi:hypothetical protein